MATLGVAGFAIEYRLAPANKYPAAWEDAQAACGQRIADNGQRMVRDIVVGIRAKGNKPRTVAGFEGAE
jgi:acetyl esterase/lipase